MGRDETRLAKVQSARRRLMTAGPKAVRSEGDFERVSLRESDADVLRDLLAPERPTTVIEIGLAYGSSALAIAEALVASESDNPRHIIIDAHQTQFFDSGWEAMVDAGLGDICSLLRERSQIALPRLLTEGLTADAAFVDGSHTFHNVFVDLHYLHQLVRPGGLVIVDDYEWPSVATAVRYFEINLAWSVEETRAPTRLHALRLPDPTPAPSFESFRPFAADATR